LKLTEDDIFVDKWDGIIPNNESMIKIYCNEEKYGIELKQQIVENQKIVDGLLSFIGHCDIMIKSYQSQLEDPISDNQEKFSLSQLEEWGRKKDDLTELIKYKTGKDIPAIHSMDMGNKN